MANDLTPATRVERLLAEILGEDYAVVPVTRIEKFLSNILGAEYDLIPATRIEKFLAKIAEEGGGGGGVSVEDILNRIVPTGEVEYSGALYTYYFTRYQNITKLTVNMTNTEIQQYTVAFNPNLETLVINAPGLYINISAYGISQNASLKTLVIKARNISLAASSLRNLTAVEVVDLENSQVVNSANFQGNSNMATLILRRSSLVSLTATSAFTSTPFASSGSGGTLYVPNDLISEYQAATNWSTILGYANNHILPIEGSIYETQYADGTPIT